MRPFALAARAVALPVAVAVMDFSNDTNAAPLCKAPGGAKGLHRAPGCAGDRRADHLPPWRLWQRCRAELVRRLQDAAMATVRGHPERPFDVDQSLKPANLST